MRQVLRGRLMMMKCCEGLKKDRRQSKREKEGMEKKQMKRDNEYRRSRRADTLL